MDKIKSNYQLVLILILLVAFAVSVVTRPDTNEVNKYVLETKIDSLNNVITNNQKMREEYELSIALLSDSISGLNEQISNNNDKLSSLQNQYAQAMDDISKFNTSDITEFFANRYN
jgi:peptidoglycan hydrolase CwlO-like protein